MRYAVFFSVLLCFAGCGNAERDPESALREWVARGEAAVEAKDRSGLLDMISEHYVDARGNDRDRIGEILRVYFYRQESIALLTSIDEITLFGETAGQIRLSVGMAGTNSNAWGFRADAYDFELELQETDGDWYLIGSKWGELGSGLH